MNSRGGNYKKEFNAEEERGGTEDTENSSALKIAKKNQGKSGRENKIRHAPTLDNCELLLLFVRGRTVEAGNWDVKQTKIDRELAAVVNQVIQDHSAKACDARHSENFFSAGE
jgi:hypothetical protein